MKLIGRWLYSHDPTPKFGEHFVADEPNSIFFHRDRLGITLTGWMTRVDMDILSMSREDLLYTIMRMRHASQARS